MLKKINQLPKPKVVEKRYEVAESRRYVDQNESKLDPAQHGICFHALKIVYVIEILKHVIKILLLTSTAVPI